MRSPNRHFTNYVLHPPEPVWIAEIQGKSVKVRTVRYRQVPDQEARRGKVTAFSPKARLRMLKFLATVNWNAVGKSSFITLTYPDEVIHKDNVRRNKERWRFHRDLEKQIGQQFATVWRVEWKPRQSGVNFGKVLPHIHLLSFVDAGIDKGTVLDKWRRIIHVDGRLEVDVQSVPEGEAVSCYVAKYCGKVSDSSHLDNVPYLNTQGRHYGYCRKDLIPKHKKTVVILRNEALVEWLRRVASASIKGYDFRFCEGFTLLGDLAEKVKIEILNSGLAHREVA